MTHICIYIQGTCKKTYLMMKKSREFEGISTMVFVTQHELQGTTTLRVFKSFSVPQKKTIDLGSKLFSYRYSLKKKK